MSGTPLPSYDPAMSVRRLYFDNAATSFPKPACVHQAMLHYAMRVGGTAGRGTYAEAREGARTMNVCRQRLCRLFHGEAPDHVVFTLNTTDALNLAIKGVLAACLRRDPARPLHVITTAMDHNSVLRPLNALAGPRVAYTRVDADADGGTVSVDALRDALRPETVLVTIIHASNVAGTIQPVADIAQLCRRRGVLVLLDAAQSLGHIPVDVQELGVDLVAFPGHKGLLGPLGTGGLYIRPGVEERLEPLRHGGTGSRSESDLQPDTLPDKYEAGSQNALGIAGLSAAVQWHLDRHPAVFEHERALIHAMLHHLDRLDALGPTFGRLGLRLIGPADPDRRVGVFSLVHRTISAHDLASVLEQNFGVLARAGLHCAPHAHRTLGSAAHGGALRLSLGPFLTADDVAYACHALEESVQALTPLSAAT